MGGGLQLEWERQFAERRFEQPRQLKAAMILAHVSQDRSGGLIEAEGLLS